MSQIDPKRQGEIGLHIVSVGTKNPVEWSSFFKSMDEVDFALADEHNFLGRLDFDKEQEAIRRLKEIKDTNQFAMEELGNRPPSQEQSVSPVEVQTLTAQVISAQPTFEILETDKGSFYNMQNWLEKLTKVFQHIEDFQVIFCMACVKANIDPTIHYISASKKKAVHSHIESCSTEYFAKKMEEL